MAKAMAGGAKMNSIFCAIPAMKSPVFAQCTRRIIKASSGFRNGTSQLSIAKSESNIQNDDEKCSNGQAQVFLLLSSPRFHPKYIPEIT